MTPPQLALNPTRSTSNPMNLTTKAVIRAALENDSSLSPSDVQSFLALLEGKPSGSGSQSDEPALLTARAAAARLGIGRTTLWRLVNDGRILPVEITPGVFRYPASDVDELAREKSRYRPRRRGRTGGRGSRKRSRHSLRATKP